jgi:alcohol oxidase
MLPGLSACIALTNFLSQLETYSGPGTEGVHGDKGPIAISGGTYRVTRSQDDFIEAAAQVGYPEYVDLQDLDTNNGVQRAQRFIGPDGSRSDTAHAYLHPKLEDGAHPNLHVLLQTQVTRVLLDGKKATGVEVRGSPRFQNGATVRKVKAEKMVIVSAGALGTPLILERSGVGDSAILKAANIPLVAHVPGVGRNYQDHHLLSYAYKSSLSPDETVDAIYGQRTDVGELIQTNASILGWNAQDVTCKLRPNKVDVAALGPEFEAAYERDFEAHAHKPMAMMSLFNG